MGAVQLESIDARGWCPAIRYALPAVIVVVGIIVAPLAIPVLPVETFIGYQRALGMNVRFETRKTTDLPQNYADMFGWPEMTATVAKVYDSLPRDERAKIAIFAQNYGEAAAIEILDAGRTQPSLLVPRPKAAAAADVAAGKSVSLENSVLSAGT